MRVAEVIFNTLNINLRVPKSFRQCRDACTIVSKGEKNPLTNHTLTSIREQKGFKQKYHLRKTSKPTRILYSDQTIHLFINKIRKIYIAPQNIRS